MLRFILVLLAVNTMLSSPIESDYVVKNDDIVNMEIYESYSDPVYFGSTAHPIDDMFSIDENDYAGHYGVDILSCALPKDLVKVDNLGRYKSHKIFKYTEAYGRTAPVGEVYDDKNMLSFESILGRGVYITFAKVGNIAEWGVEDNSVVNEVNMALAETKAGHSFYAHFIYKGVNFKIVTTVSRKEFVDILYSITSL